jgi:Mg2+/citrate symporter
MDVNKIRKFCRVFRIIIGLALIATGIIIGNAWFYLGVLPLVAGLTNFCPICMITKKCDLPQNGDAK